MYLNHSYHVVVKLNFRKIKNFKIFEECCLIFLKVIKESYHVIIKKVL